MRILQVFDWFSLPHGGGTVDLVYKMSRALVQRGHEVVIYTSDFELDQKYIDSLAEVKVRTFHCLLNFAGFYIMPEMIEEVKKELRNFDIIHLHCLRSFQNIVIHHYAKKYGIPYIVDTHGSLPRKAAGDTGLKWLLRWLFDLLFGSRILNDAAMIVTENKFGLREYEAFGAKNRRVAVIPLFFPIEDFVKFPPRGQFRNRFGIKAKNIIMFLGRINRIKGLDFLVKSFYELSLSRKDVVLAIVGPEDGYKDTIQKLAARLGIQEKVLFTGFLGGQDKLAALVDADVFVQPSRYEQAAWAPIEAVLCGTPVIVSSNSGSGEDVSRMDAGYLADYGNRRQMVQTMQAILDDPSEAKEMVRRAQEFIRTNLSLKEKVKEYEKLYEECITMNTTSRRAE